MGIKFKARQRRKKLIRLLIIILIIHILLNMLKKLDIHNINKYIVDLGTNKLNINIKPTNILYFGLNTKIKMLKSPNTINLVNNDPPKEPIIYIYNTHQSEEYDKAFNEAYNIAYTTWNASYILSDYLNKENIPSIVENNSIKEYLLNNNLKYNMSYNASRVYINQKLSEYNSIKYLIDLHRDSLSKDKTTVLINNKNYAKIKFVVGLDNPSYINNLALARKLSDNLGLISGGIIEKKGKKVNGVYNQDISPNALLIEVGGVDNNIEEVSLSLKEFANVLSKEITNER